MKITTKFYGEIECDTQEIIRFPQGIPGFENEQEFILLTSEASIFSWLQSVSQKEVAFVVISPDVVCTDYNFELDEAVCSGLKLTKPEDALIVAIVTIPPGRVEQATVNLQAPVVINTLAKLGQQIILNDQQYPIRQPLWNQDKVPVTKR